MHLCSWVIEALVLPALVQALTVPSTSNTGSSVRTVTNPDGTRILERDGNFPPVNVTFDDIAIPRPDQSLRIRDDPQGEISVRCGCKFPLDNHQDRNLAIVGLQQLAWNEKDGTLKLGAYGKTVTHNKWAIPGENNTPGDNTVVAFICNRGENDLYLNAANIRESFTEAISYWCGPYTSGTHVINTKNFHYTIGYMRWDHQDFCAASDISNERRCDDSDAARAKQEQGRLEPTPTPVVRV